MKKAFRIALYTIAGILVLAIAGSYAAYNSFSPKDPSVPADPSFISYYHGSYNDCRQAFRNAAEKLASESDSVETGKIMVASKTDNDLSIDWCYVPSKGKKEKLLIINSGLHGIDTGHVHGQDHSRELSGRYGCIAYTWTQSLWF